MTVKISLNGNIIEERKTTEQEANMYLLSDNIVINKDIYVIDESTLDMDERVVQLSVHEF